MYCTIKTALSSFNPNNSYPKCGLERRDNNNPYYCDNFRGIISTVLFRNDQTVRDNESNRTLLLRALSTSDFKELLSDVNTKILTKGWNDCPVTYPMFTRLVEVPNFKENSLISLSSFSKLEKMAEFEEITHGGRATESETFKLETFAKIFSVTERAFTRDMIDGDSLKTAPLLMGASARQTVEETVYSVLLSNPVLADGIQLCHADHSNLINRCTKYC